MAIVAELLPSDDICRLTSFQTAPWLDRCPPPIFVDCVTDSFSTDRSFVEE